VTHRAFIGLGSNLGNPAQQVKSAIRELGMLPDSERIASSSLYRSTALGPGEQPDYINAVVELRTTLKPEALLDQLQRIEAAHGRTRGPVRWTARTLDLDLLLYGNQILVTDRLTVPHPCLAERNFVLYPLHEVAPELALPNGDSLAALLSRVSPEGIQRLDASFDH